MLYKNRLSNYEVTLVKQAIFTLPSLCLLIVALLAFGPAAAIAKNGKSPSKGRKPETSDKPEAKTAIKLAGRNSLPTALLDQVEAWSQTADFWKLIERGEQLAAQLDIQTVKSNQFEAWVCGQAKVCISSRLLREFPAEAQQAVVAHELGHFLIPRDYEAHPQLWEAQCDVFAVAFLRDSEQMKQMLLQLGDACSNCQDREHPVPSARAALVEHCSAKALKAALKFDEFRLRSFAVQYHNKRHGVPRGLQQLSFSINNVFNTPMNLEGLKTLHFAIGFHVPSQKR